MRDELGRIVQFVMRGGLEVGAAKSSSISSNVYAINATKSGEPSLTVFTL